MLKKILVRHGVALRITDGDVRDNGRCVVVGIIFVSGELESHTRGIWLGNILVAVAVQVCHLASIVVDARGTFVAGEMGRVELLGVRLVVLLGGRVLDRERVGLGGATYGDANHGFWLNQWASLVLVRGLVEEDN